MHNVGLKTSNIFDRPYIYIGFKAPISFFPPQKTNPSFYFLPLKKDPLFSVNLGYYLMGSSLYIYIGFKAPIIMNYFILHSHMLVLKHYIESIAPCIYRF